MNIPCYTAVMKAHSGTALVIFLTILTLPVYVQGQERATTNPFHKFFGEWTLKNNDWRQNWGNGDESIKIEKHYTISKALNTDNSLLSVIDTPPRGHIFWVYNPITKAVNHLSSFGEIRTGVGHGTVSDRGDVQLRISFEGEAAGTYRIYNYTWVSDDEYELKSVQFNAQGLATGLFYGGNFVRIKR